MLKPAVKTIKINRYKNKQFASCNDLVAIEEPLEIRITYGLPDSRKQKNISVTMRTPGNDFELATGFLFTEGIIKHVKEIYSITYCSNINKITQQDNIVNVELQADVLVDIEKLNRHFYTTSSCGVCGKSSIDAVQINCDIIPNDNTKIQTSTILNLPKQLTKRQTVFEHTGGIHASALFSENGELCIVREDVGRHNALDKLIGACITNQINTSNTILLLSGRASFELIQKAAVASIPVVCAIGAPSSLAVELANETGITLIGFLKNESFNVYTHHFKIK